MKKTAAASREVVAGTARPRILIADDEQSMREWMRLLFQRDGFEVLTAEDGIAARETIAREYVDVVLTDIRMPRLDGVGLLRSIRESAPDVIVAMMTAHWSQDSEDWAEAQSRGAEALFEKPFRDVNLVTMQVRQLLESRRLRHENVVLRRTTAEQGFAGIIGRSSKMVEVFRLVETVCRTNSTVLISGESGTGKELVARAMHTLSLRRDHPFVAVNCGAMPEALLESELFGHVRGAFTGADKDKKGLIEAADGGTVFLDEIGEMSPTMQVKLLRVLAGAQVSARRRHRGRLVEHPRHRRDQSRPAEACRRGKVSRRPVLSPQRHSREDAGAARSRRRCRPDRGALSREVHARDEQADRRLRSRSPGALGAYSWPGNVRELENTVERAVALESERRVELAALPDHVREGRPATSRPDDPIAETGSGFNLERHLQDIERSHLERALERAGGVQTRAADVLGLSFRQFRYLMKKHGLKRESDPSASLGSSRLSPVLERRS